MLVRLTIAITTAGLLIHALSFSTRHAKPASAPEGTAAPCASTFVLRKAMFLPGCIPGDGCRRLTNLAVAQRACASLPACGGVTSAGPSSFELRSASRPADSPVNETTWTLRPCPTRLGGKVLSGAPRRTGLAASSARTPPRGWSSWNCLRGGPTQAKLSAVMRVMATQRRSVLGKAQRLLSLADLGYVNVGLDDGWQLCGAPGVEERAYHLASGHPVVDARKFPDLGSMVGLAHRLGLRSGFYVNNCLCSEHSLRTPEAVALAMERTAEAIVSLGFDAVKIDSCGELKNLSRWRELLGPTVAVENCFQGGLVPTNSTLPAIMSDPRGASHPNVEIAQSNNGCSGALEEEQCPYQYYRTSADIDVTWESVMANLISAVAFSGDKPLLSRPGLWAYPDMLVVGFLPTAVEDRSHFGAWAVLSSPLTLSFDLTDTATLDRVWPIISNVHLLRVNAAWAGSPGRLVRATAEHMLFAKPLGGGEHAVFVLATGSTSTSVEIRMPDVVGTTDDQTVVRVLDAYDDARDLGQTLVEGRAFATGPIEPRDSRFYLFVSTVRRVTHS